MIDSLGQYIFNEKTDISLINLNSNYDINFNRDDPL